MSSDTEQRLIEIEKRMQKAPEGPWEMSEITDMGCGRCVKIGELHPIRVSTPSQTTRYKSDRVTEEQRDAIASFVAHSRDDVQFLIDTVRDLQCAIENESETLVEREESACSSIG